MAPAQTSRPDLAHTKVRAPHAGAALPRPRLDEHWAELPAYTLTTVSAGAGFGKTTILRIWAERAVRDMDVAWVGFEEEDAGVRTVAAYLDAALRVALPDFGRTVAGLLDEGHAEPEPFARAIVNELFSATEDGERDIVLFLDDFHSVQEHEGVRRLIGGILRFLPPRAHLAIASRFPLDFSPIVKLRADDRVADISQDDLRFTSDEALELLRAAGVDSGDPDALESVVQRTDGWAMGLRLSVQTAVRGLSTHSAIVADGSERSLFAYLAEEVLRAQPPELRETLFACAVPKSFDPPVLNRILARTDGREAIEALLRRNLYVIEAVDGRTYRFHHLFREFLIETMLRDEPQRLRELRLRYARYLEERGDLMEAVAQFVEAGDFIAAADYVSQVQFTIKYGEGAERIAALLDGLPEELKRERPRLLQFEATARRRRLDFAGADAAFERARLYALEQNDFATACSCALERGMLADELRAGGHGTFEASLAHFRDALAHAEQSGARRDVYIKMASLAMGLAHAARFEYDLAKPYLARAEALQRAAATQRSDSLTTIATIFGWQGEWQKALETAELAEDLLRNSGADSLLGRALKVQAKAHYFLRDDLDRALHLAEAAIEAERAHNEDDDLPDAYVVLARAHLAQSVPQIDRAHAALDEAARRLERRANRVTQFDLHAARFETYILTGRPAEARRELASAQARSESNADPLERATVTFLEGVFHAGSGEHALAAERFAAAHERFVPLHDKFFAQLSDLAARAAEARIGALDAPGFEAMLDRFGSAASAVALRSAPRSVSLLLAWALRNGAGAERAETLLEEAALRAGDEDLVALAHDVAAPSDARARAVALIAKARQPERRPMLAKLARDKNAAIALAATTALALFPEPPAARLTIHLVGPLRLRIGDDTIDERDGRWSRRKSVEMLRALALAESPVSKTVLVADLWPEAEAAAAETSLRVTLHALRRALEPEAEGTGSYVDYDGTTLALRRGVVASVDAHEALSAFKRAAFARASKAPAEAETLYARAIDLLSAVPAEENVPAWLASHVRQWRRTLVAALRACAELRREAGSTAAAAMFVDRALVVDPLDEDAVRVALEVAMDAHDLERARNTFVEYKRRLAAELSAAPGPELMARYGQVLKARAENRSGQLTPRELQILSAIGRGRSNKQIAAELSLSAWTVNGHVARILRKMRVDSRAAAVAAAGGLLES